jgi:hypothetical protein
VPKPQSRNKGAIEFSKLTESTAELAEILSISVNYVQQLRSGNRTPATHNRLGKPLVERIRDRWPHITPDLWLQDNEPSSEQLETAGALLDAVEMPDEASDDPIKMARRHVAYAHVAERSLREALRNGEPNAVKDLVALTNVPIHLGKLLGHSLTEREVLDSPPFRDLTRRVMAAIESFPNAGEIAKAIQDALEVEA